MTVPLPAGMPGPRDFAMSGFAVPTAAPLNMNRKAETDMDGDIDMQRRDRDLDTVHQFFRRIAEVCLVSRLHEEVLTSHVGPISTSTAIGMSLSLMHSMNGGQGRGQEDETARERGQHTNTSNADTRIGEHGTLVATSATPPSYQSDRVVSVFRETRE